MGWTRCPARLWSKPLEPGPRRPLTNKVGKFLLTPSPASRQALQQRFPGCVHSLSRSKIQGAGGVTQWQRVLDTGVYGLAQEAHLAPRPGPRIPAGAPQRTRNTPKCTAPPGTTACLALFPEERLKKAHSHVDTVRAANHMAWGIFVCTGKRTDAWPAGHSVAGTKNSPDCSRAVHALRGPGSGCPAPCCATCPGSRGPPGRLIQAATSCHAGNELRGALGFCSPALPMPGWPPCPPRCEQSDGWRCSDTLGDRRSHFPSGFIASHLRSQLRRFYSVLRQKAHGSIPSPARGA